MRYIEKYLQTNLSCLKIVCVLAILSLICIPLLFSHGRLFIGGDMIIPFDGEQVSKYLWQWQDMQNGTFFSLNYYSQYLYFKALDLITDNVYLKGALLLFFINVFAVYGVFKLLRLIDDEVNVFGCFLILVFYLLSPMHYNAWIYLQVYALIPWFFYYVLKSIKYNRIDFLDIVSLNIVVFFASLDLPNPKYLFYLFSGLGVAFAGALLFKRINFDFFLKSKVKLFLFFSLSSYLFIPLANFAINYHPSHYSVGVKAGYTNKVAAKMMDYGVSTVDKMVRLFHDGVAFDPAIRSNYLTNPFVIVANLFFIILIILYFLKNNKRSFHDFILMVLSLFYLFLAVGPNQPFGFIYEIVVTRISVLAFMRTTAGAVFFLSLMYSLLLFSALKHFNNKWLNISFAAALLFTSYPLLNGEYYRNWSPCNSFINKNEYGLKVPEAYFGLKSVINSKKLDARIFVPNANLSYLNMRWGYFGPAALYYFLYNGYFIGNDQVFADLPKHNVGYVFMDDSIYGGGAESSFFSKKNEKVSPLDSEFDFLRLYSVKKGGFLPVVYSPSSVIRSNPPAKKTPIDVAILDNERPIQTVIGTKFRPVLEYKKINPTKYRIIAHGVRGDFMVVLSEKYHNLWKIYLADNAPVQNHQSFSLVNAYKIFAGNGAEQAAAAELSQYVRNGWVTTLGNGESRKINHYHYTPISRKLIDTESYAVDFVSKNNYGTIQNDNLRNGSVFETLFLKALPNANHQLVNYYANAWVIDADLVKRSSPASMVQNGDGSFDLEMIVEFSPQRVFYFSLILTLLSLLVVIFLMLREWLSKRGAALGDNS